MRPPRVSRTIGVSRLQGRTLAPAADALLSEIVGRAIIRKADR